MDANQPRIVHVLSLPTQGVADHVAAQLRDSGFDPVDTRPVGAGCEVRVADPRLPDADGGAALEGLRSRFEALAEEHEGTYSTEEGRGLAS